MELLPGIRNTARALIVRDRHVLLLHKEGDRYALPGGAQDAGETLEAALQRECREEIGIAVEAPALLTVCDVFKRKQSEPPTRRHLVDFIFAAGVPASYVARNGPRPDKRQLAVRWVQVDDLPGLAFSPDYLAARLPELIHAAGAPEANSYSGAFHDLPHT